MQDQRDIFILMGEIMVHLLADENEIIERKKVNDVTARGEFSFYISDWVIVGAMTILHSLEKHKLLGEGILFFTGCG